MLVPTGRYERRVPKAEVVELLHVGESPNPKLEAITENVSPRGARVITDSMCAPGEMVRLEAPKEHLSLPACVVYCSRLGENKFAVGLRLNARFEKWHSPLKS